jgi:hypothetical protein
MDRLDADPLYQRVTRLTVSGTCARMVPIEFAATSPVPYARGKESFKLLFFLTIRERSQYTVLTPQVEATFSLHSPAGDSCTVLPVPKPQPLGSPVPTTSLASNLRLQVRLYDALGKTAPLYFKGGDVRPEDRRILAKYTDAFMKLTEPGLLPYYYRLNPDFWEWLRKQCGRSIPPAAAR